MTDWAIPKQIRLKYTQMFNFHDRSCSGFLSGNQCKSILLQSGLSKNILARIWNLSDVDGDGQLTREEFILAMHLIDLVKAGENLPKELYSNLIPPSHRKTMMSTNPELANQDCLTNDTQRPVSVTLSNNFYDKRKDNFERGQAELEKRRLKIIEQQLDFTREHLTTSNAQFLEIKSKIETLHAKCNDKINHINLLKARLQATRRQKALLGQEELDLSNATEDLELLHVRAPVTRTSHEQSLKLDGKEKLAKLINEKDVKNKQLELTKARILNYASELEIAFEKAHVIYEKYKTSLAKAEQLLLNIEICKEKDTNSSQPDLVDVKGISGATRLISTPPNDPSTISWGVGDSAKSVILNPLKPTNQETLNIEQRASKLYLALYAFEARNPDELTLNAGDKILVEESKTCEPGWLYGESNNQRGLFPEGYVRDIGTEVEAAQDESVLEQASQSSAPVARAHQSTHRIKNSYRAVYAFSARTSDELTIEPGDVITGAASADEPGWLRGEMNGRLGLFPEAYVRRINDDDDDDDATIRSGEETAEVSSSLSPSIQSQNSQQSSMNHLSFDGLHLSDDSFERHGSSSNGSGGRRRRSQLSHLIGELVKTESTYLDDLLLCYVSYIKPLRCSFKDVNEIFLRWDELIQKHLLTMRKLSPYIKYIENNLCHVLEIYKDLLCSSVDLYIAFCSQQSQSTKKYEAKRASDLRFKQLVNECQRKIARSAEQQVLVQVVQKDHSSSDDEFEELIQDRKSCVQRNSHLPLTSFMLKPMQRITKYNLLFDRVHEMITKDGLAELSELAQELKVSARVLCQKVNEACRVRENLEDNKRKLRWARIHIELGGGATTGSCGERQQPELIDSSPAHSFDDSHFVVDRACGSARASMSSRCETEFSGSKMLIKAGSLLRGPNFYKEFVLFLFDDKLMITKTTNSKSSSPLRAEDVFSSTRAQRSYYKFYDEVNLKDIIIHASPEDLISQQEQQDQSGEQQQQQQHNFEVAFSDKSTGASYILSALSMKERVEWLRQLEIQSTQAKKVNSSGTLSSPDR